MRKLRANRSQNPDWPAIAFPVSFFSTTTPKMCSRCVVSLVVYFRLALDLLLRSLASRNPSQLDDVGVTQPLAEIMEFNDGTVGALTETTKSHAHFFDYCMLGFG